MVTIQDARDILAARYEERSMMDAARDVKSGAWDKEPFMLAMCDAMGISQLGSESVKKATADIHSSVGDDEGE